MVNEFDSYVPSKSDKHGIVIICLYIDDMLIFGTSIDVIKLTKDFQNSKFEMKELGEAHLILRIKMKKSKFGFSS